MSLEENLNNLKHDGQSLKEWMMKHIQDGTVKSEDFQSTIRVYESIFGRQRVVEIFKGARDEIKSKSEIQKST